MRSTPHVPVRKKKINDGDELAKARKKKNEQKKEREQHPL